MHWSNLKQYVAVKESYRIPEAPKYSIALFMYKG